jgi:hypothetical protein
MGIMSETVYPEGIKIIQPMVGRRGLPWVIMSKNIANPNGVESVPDPRDTILRNDYWVIL